MGDNLHQRAVIKQLKEKYDIYLETSWPQIYWDMPDINFVAKGTKLRTQLKNQYANFHCFTGNIPEEIPRMKITYRPDMVRRCGSVLGAMMQGTGTKIEEASIKFDPAPEWVQEAKTLLDALEVDKPIMIYRPLIVRKEWGGCEKRNPDIGAYKNLFDDIREKFYVISIADLVPSVEWAVSHPIQANAEFHNGDLDFSVIAALFKRASLVYCSPGFATVLARCVETPVITVFGGYENGESFSVGEGPYLPIDTIQPCNCFSHFHKCNKNIDINNARHKIQEFVNAHVT